MIHVLFDPPYYISTAQTDVLRLGYSRSSRRFWWQIMRMPPEQRIQALQEEVNRIFSIADWKNLGEVEIDQTIVIHDSLSKTEIKRLFIDVFSVARYTRKGKLADSYGWIIGKPFPFGFTRESLLAEMTTRLMLEENGI